jgi:hypothetical protein
MKKKLFVLSSILLLIASSCKKKDESPEINAFGLKTIEEAEAVLGKYAGYFSMVEGSVFTTVSQYNDLPDLSYSTFARFNAVNTASRSNGGVFFLNDLEFYFDESAKSYVVKGLENDTEHKLLKPAVEKMYGTQVNAKLVKDGKEVVNISYYSPKKLNAKTNNEIVPLTSFYEVKQEEGIEISWDRDEKNSNGVVLYVAWTGDKINLSAAEQGTAGFKEFVSKVDDTGKVKMPYSYFKELPAGAIFTIFVMRGNIEIVKGTDAKSYRFYNLSENLLRCVLK